MTTPTYIRFIPQLIEEYISDRRAIKDLSFFLMMKQYIGISGTIRHFRSRYQELARVCGVSETTIRQRVKGCIHRGWMWIPDTQKLDLRLLSHEKLAASIGVTRFHKETWSLDCKAEDLLYAIAVELNQRSQERAIKHKVINSSPELVTLYRKIRSAPTNQRKWLRRVFDKEYQLVLCQIQSRTVDPLWEHSPGSINFDITITRMAMDRMIGRTSGGAKLRRMVHLGLISSEPRRLRVMEGDINLFRMAGLCKSVFRVIGSYIYRILPNKVKVLIAPVNG